MKEIRITLRNAGKTDPESIEEYIKAGGYTGPDERLFMNINDMEDYGALQTDIRR